MKLPNLETAIIAPEKITKYLLSTTHKVGRHKAAFFMKYGFTVDAWQVLADALRDHAREYEVCKVEESPFGIRYVIEGSISTPVGRDVNIRSVWFISNGEENPKLVTAYAMKGKSHDSGT